VVGVGLDPENGAPLVCWKMPDGQTDVARTRVMLRDESLDAIDPETGATVPGTRAAAGHWFALCTSDDATAAQLHGLPGFAVEFERPEIPTQWRHAVTAFGLPDVDPATLLIAAVSPIWAGGRYTFD